MDKTGLRSMFQKTMGLGEITHTVIQNSGTLCICKPSKSNLRLSEYDDSKQREKEKWCSSCGSLWSRTVAQPKRKLSALKKQLQGYHTTTRGSAPSASKCKPKAHVYVMIYTSTTVNIFATWLQTFYFISKKFSLKWVQQKIWSLTTLFHFDTTVFLLRSIVYLTVK